MPEIVLQSEKIHHLVTLVEANKIQTSVTIDISPTQMIDYLKLIRAAVLEVGAGK